MVGVRCESIVELFGHDLSEHGIGGFFNRKTREVFDENDKLVGIASKDLTEKQQWDLCKKLVECRMMNQSPHLLSHNKGRRLSLSDMMQAKPNMDMTMRKIKEENRENIAAEKRLSQQL